jgi:hypothetical protein
MNAVFLCLSKISKKVGKKNFPLLDADYKNWIAFSLIRPLLNGFTSKFKTVEEVKSLKNPAMALRYFLQVKFYPAYGSF